MNGGSEQSRGLRWPRVTFRGLGMGLMVVAFVLFGIPMPAQAQGTETGGLGGTGLSQETGGIGGTGIRQAPGRSGGTSVGQDTGGIGGTGAPIVGFGPIQRFGSVFVNGREYRVNAQTLVTIDGQPATVSALRVGDMALVRGIETGTRGGVARTISSWQSIIGPITGIAPNRQRFTVLGQTVIAPTATRNFTKLQVGEVVGISAQRQADGNWVAHRITPLPPASNFRLETTVSSVGNGRINLGGFELRATKSMLAGIRPGERVVAMGMIHNGKASLTRITPKPLLLGAPGTRIEVRNFFRSIGGGRLMAEDGMEATGATSSKALSGLEPVEIDGRVSENGSIAITAMAIDLPEMPDYEASHAGNRADEPPEGHSIAPQGGAIESNAEKSHASETPTNVEPPEVGETMEPETPEIETPEIEVPEPQTPEPDIDAPEVEPPSDQ